MPSRHSSSRSALLRALPALPLIAAVLIAAVLAVPHRALAQGPSDAGVNALPDAPLPAFAQAADVPTLVNGRRYRKPTRREDLRAYEFELIGVRAFVGSGIRAGIEQARTAPTGWGQDFPGYMQRYGSAFGEFGIDSSVRYGLAAVLHEDVRYLLCHKCSAGDKVENALLSEVTARHGKDGRRSFALTPLAAEFSGPLVAYAAWYPPGYNEGDAAKHAMFNLGFRIAGHMVREFFFDKDTKHDTAP